MLAGKANSCIFEDTVKHQTMSLRFPCVMMLLLLSFVSKAQDVKWIPFHWTGDTISGKYFDKSAIVIPVSIENIPARFNMQFDLGAVRTVIYGNSIAPYLEAYPELKKKIDPSKTFLIQGENNPMFSRMSLKMGGASFDGLDIGYFKNYGGRLSKEDLLSDAEKHIGTIGPDLFQGKILIIDYPKKRIGICEALPRQYREASFQPFKSGDGRPKIPLTINGKTQYVMFDTGSSIFTLQTTKKEALDAAGAKIIDSLTVNSWGKKLTFYGVKAKKPIKFGTKVLEGSTLYYDEQETFQDFYKFVEILGLTGNAFFLNSTVIIDYKNKLFGVL